jgi:LacI family transcriptional regulator
MVKLAEIAKASGFSIPVVSRVLNPNPNIEAKIAPKTRQLILKTAERMKYRPNRNAEFLKRGQNPVIGVFLPHFRNGLITDLVMGISESAQKHGFPVSFSFETSFKSYRKFIEETSGRRNCGIITYPYFQLDREATKLIEDYRHNGGKLVLINAANSLYQVPHVDMDEYYGGTLAAAHLLERGCEEFMIVEGIPERRDGFAARLKEAGANCAIYPECVDSYHAIIKQCRANNRQTGIFTCADRMAVPLHNMLLQAGLTPGDRVKLIGYDNMFLTQHLSPPLTTISQPFAEAGSLAMDRLVDIIYERETESVTLKPELIVRKTT